MNQYPGVLGRKLGMTQIFVDDGTVVPCTVVESRPVVVGKRTQERDGYHALVLGVDDFPEARQSKPVAGQFKKVGAPARRNLREFRCTAEFAGQYEVGQALALDVVFAQGQWVDVRGVSRGRGFTGVMRRHKFKGSKNQTHGTHEYQRHGGSIGTRLTPGRTKPGQRMGGHHGAANVTVPSQKVVKISPEDGVIFIRGGIPGARGGLVEVRGAMKKRNGGMPKA